MPLLKWPHSGFVMSLTTVTYSFSHYCIKQTYSNVRIGKWLWKLLCGLTAQEGGMFLIEKLIYKISIYKEFKKKQNSTCKMKDNILQNSTSDLPTSTWLHKVLNSIRK